MGFFFRREFWGFALIALGALWLGNLFFGLHIPVFGTFIAILLIGLGLSMLQGFRGDRSETEVMFDEAKMVGAAGKRTYNTIFGRGLVDWTKMTPKGKGDYLEANAIFSESIVRIDPKVPMRIKASAVFGETRLPDGSSVSFGDREYTTKSYKAGSPHFRVQANAVFGSLKIVED